MSTLSTTERPHCKRTWTPQEDATIVQLVTEHGAVNWGFISEHLTNRTGKQCRERYHNHLQPDVKKGDWSEKEDQLIISLQEQYGNCWAKITKHLPGRTDNAVKNRWHAAMRAQAKLNEEKQGNRTVVPNLPLDCLSSSGVAKVPATIEEIVRKYSPRFQSEMQLSDVCDLNLVSHGHHMHDHTPTTARTVDYNEEPNGLAMEKDAFSGLCIPIDASAHVMTIQDIDETCILTENNHLKDVDFDVLSSCLSDMDTDSDSQFDISVQDIFVDDNDDDSVYSHLTENTNDQAIDLDTHFNLNAQMQFDSDSDIENGNKTNTFTRKNKRINKNKSNLIHGKYNYSFTTVSPMVSPDYKKKKYNSSCSLFEDEFQFTTDDVLMFDLI